MKLSITITLCTLLYFSGPFTEAFLERYAMAPPGPYRPLIERKGEWDPKAECDDYRELMDCSPSAVKLCATDDNTYDNICELCDARTRSGLDLWVRDVGACPEH